MSSTVRRILFTIGYVVVALLAVAAVGFARYQQRFPELPETMLEYALFGFMAALIYASVQLRGSAHAVAVVVFWWLLRTAMKGDLLAFAGPATYALPVGFALMAASYIQKSLVRFKIGRFLTMGAIVGLGYGLYKLSHLIVGEGGLTAIGQQALLGAELGAAVGLGFELVDLFGPPPEYE